MGEELTPVPYFLVRNIFLSVMGEELTPDTVFSRSEYLSLRYG